MPRRVTGGLVAASLALGVLTPGCWAPKAVKLVVIGDERQLRERAAGTPENSPERPPILYLALDGVGPAEHGITGNEYFVREERLFACPAPVSFSPTDPRPAPLHGPSPDVIAYDPAHAESGKDREVLYWHTLSTSPLEPLFAGGAFPEVAAQPLPHALAKLLEA